MVDQLNAFAGEVTRVAREVGSEGKLGGQARVEGVGGTWRDLTESVNFMAGNLTSQVRNIAEVTTAVAKGDLSKKITVDVRGEILELKNTINTMVDQLNGVRLGSDARRARSRYRRQTRRTGRGSRRRRHVERPHRLGELHGRQPDVAGAQHRRRHDRRRQRRPLEEDHGYRSRRDPRTQKHDQHDGRPAQRLRVRGHARRARGRFRRQARRPGAGARRRRHVEGPHRLGQLDGRQPHVPGPQHRRSHDRRRQRRPLAEDHGRRARRNPRAEDHDQHDGRPAQRVRRRGDARRARSRFRRQARRPGGGPRRRRHVEGSHRLRELHGRQPDVAGPQHRRSHDRRRQGRPLEEDHGRRARRDPRAEEHRSTRWSTSSTAFASEVTRVAREVGYRRQTRRTGARAAASAARGRTSPTRSTPWPPT